MYLFPSGDATLVTPPRDINEETLVKIRQITSAIAKETNNNSYSRV